MKTVSEWQDDLEKAKAAHATEISKLKAALMVLDATIYMIVATWLQARTAMTPKEQVDFDWLVRAMSLRPQTPAGRSGKLSVEHRTLKAGEPIDVVSLRNGLFMGQQPTRCCFDEDTTLRTLKHADKGVWMQDIPQEIWQAQGPVEAVKALGGKPRVLVGGLGLGCYSALLLSMTKANVTTIEISRDVIKLVSPFVAHRRHKVCRGDVYKYAELLKRGYYHAAILDTWQPTGEMCWVSEVIPLRRLVRPKIEHVFCWNEREMIGQFGGPFGGAYRALARRAEESPDMDRHHRTVRLAAEEEGLIDSQTSAAQFCNPGHLEEWLKFELSLRADAAVVDLVESFCRDIGSPEWEERFGRHWERAGKIRQRKFALRKAKASV